MRPFLRTCEQSKNKQLCKPDCLTNYLLEEGIQWSFISERSSWKAGSYERYVGLLRAPLKRVIGKQLMSYLDFNTLLQEVVQLVNNRPLLQLVDDNMHPSFHCLKPNDFLAYGIHSQAIQIDSEELEDADYVQTISTRAQLQNYWQSQVALLDRFWKAYFQMYLAELMQKQKLMHRDAKGAVRREPIIGEICLLNQEPKRRGCWPLCKVVEIKRGADHKVRTVTVIDAKGKTFIRANSFSAVRTEPSVSAYSAPLRTIAKRPKFALAG